MPTYDFLDKRTGKRFSQFMSLSEAEAMVKAEPDLEWLCGTPAIGDPWRMGRAKPPDYFRDRLKDIKKTHRGSNINTW